MSSIKPSRRVVPTRHEALVLGELAHVFPFVLSLLNLLWFSNWTINSPGPILHYTSTGGSVAAPQGMPSALMNFTHSISGGNTFSLVFKAGERCSLFSLQVLTYKG